MGGPTNYYMGDPLYGAFRIHPIGFSASLSLVWEGVLSISQSALFAVFLARPIP